MLYGKLQQAVRQTTNREGGGCLLPDYQCTKIQRPVAEFLREKHPDTRVPLVENPVCTSFEEYGDVPKTVPLDFMEDDVTWVTSKIFGTAGTLGAEAIELRKWLLRFGYVSED